MAIFWDRKSPYYNKKNVIAYGNFNFNTYILLYDTRLYNERYMNVRDFGPSSQSCHSVNAMWQVLIIKEVSCFQMVCSTKDEFPLAILATISVMGKTIINMYMLPFVNQTLSKTPCLNSCNAFFPFYPNASTTLCRSDSQTTQAIQKSNDHFQATLAGVYKL